LGREQGAWSKEPDRRQIKPGNDFNAPCLISREAAKARKVGRVALNAPDFLQRKDAKAQRSEAFR
jgi:hypothetical protein